MAQQPAQTVPARSRPKQRRARDASSASPWAAAPLRQHAARGTVINAGFDVGVAGLGVARRFLVAIFLTASDYGVWGLIFVAVDLDPVVQGHRDHRQVHPAG